MARRAALMNPVLQGSALQQAPKPAASEIHLNVITRRGRKTLIVVGFRWYGKPKPGFAGAWPLFGAKHHISPRESSR
jgi:hypothetical protein